ncbi:6-bladed beta-propeller [bacterium]|nr:6-bladed beta-propeller [bacterium]
MKSKKAWQLLNSMKIMLIVLSLAGSSFADTRHSITPKFIDQVVLSVDIDCAFAGVNDMVIDTQGNFIIVDSYQTRGVYVFDNKGDFIQKIGRSGQGPGEFSEPTSIAINSAGQILIADYMGRRVNVYNADYTFIKSIIMHSGMQRHVFMPEPNQIIMYNGMLHPISNRLQETIVKYDTLGNEISSFAQLQPEVQMTEFSCFCNGVCLDSMNNIYEINPVYYQIRKFNLNGDLLVTRTPESSMYNTDKKIVIINGPFMVDSKYMLVQIENCIDVFNLECKRIVTEQPFKEKIILAHGNMFYTIVWPDEDIESGDQRAVIKWYKLD